MGPLPEILNVIDERRVKWMTSRHHRRFVTFPRHLAKCIR